MPKFEHTSLGKKMEGTQNLMPFVALTVMVILRKNLGYRLMKPSWLFGVTLVQIVASVIIPNGGRSDALFYFAWVTFALGLFHRFIGWRKIDRGVLQHSFYIGDSRLSFKWLPEFFRRKRRVERFIDPLVVLIIGIILLFFLPLLGFWLFMSAACVRVFELDIYERDTNRGLDAMDSLVMSEVQIKIVEKFERPPSARPPPDASVPTGMADDIQEQIKRRKAKPTPPPQEI